MPAYYVTPCILIIRLAGHCNAPVAATRLRESLSSICIPRFPYPRTDSRVHRFTFAPSNPPTVLVSSSFSLQLPFSSSACLFDGPLETLSLLHLYIYIFDEVTYRNAITRASLAFRRRRRKVSLDWTSINIASGSGILRILPGVQRAFDFQSIRWRAKFKITDRLIFLAEVSCSCISRRSFIPRGAL